MASQNPDHTSWAVRLVTHTLDNLQLSPFWAVILVLISIVFHTPDDTNLFINVVYHWNSPIKFFTVVSLLENKRGEKDKQFDSRYVQMKED
jgi:hypothetical protein